MKNFIKEYFHLFGTIFVGLIFGVGFYYILLNAFHAASVDKEIYVNVNDVYYENYRENLDNIKNNMNNYAYNSNKFDVNITKMQRVYASISSCYNVLLEDNGLMGLKNAQLMRYIDVYNLNNNFVKSLVDKCYVSNLNWIKNDSELNKKNILSKLDTYAEMIDILENNSSYLKEELRDNSSYYYNTGISNTMIRNNLNSSYRLIIKNYHDFSKIILELSNYLVRGDNNG